MRNGEEIASLAPAINAGDHFAQRPPSSPATLTDTTSGGSPQGIFVAAAYMPSAHRARPITPMSYLQGVLDNCRLSRLGTEHPTALPAGAAPRQRLQYARAPRWHRRSPVASMVPAPPPRSAAP